MTRINADRDTNVIPATPDQIRALRAAARKDPS